MAFDYARVEGGRELRRTLRQAGSDLSELKAAHQKVVDAVLTEARTRAPRRTGNLAASRKATAAKTAGTVKGGNRRKGPTGVPYAGPIHWGWPGHNIEPNTFLVDAAETTRPTWVGIYEQEIDRILDQVKGTTQ